MIYHLVLFKLQSNVSEEQLRNFYVGLECLKDIPGVSKIQCGACDKLPYASYADRSAGYSHALLVVLKDWKALEDYDKNSFHGVVKDTVIKPLLDLTAERPVLAVDWEGVVTEENPWDAVGFFLNTRTLIATGALALLVYGGLHFRSRL